MKNLTWILTIFLLLSMGVQAQDTKKVSQESLRSKYEYAVYLKEQNKVTESLEVSEEILELEKDAKNDSLRLEVFDLMGDSYELTNNDSLAISVFEKSLELSKKLKDTLKIIALDDKIGMLYRDLKEYETSNIYFQELVDIALKRDDSLAIKPLYNIGNNILLSDGNKGLAVKYIIDSKKILEANDYKSLRRTKVDIYDALGRCYYMLEEYRLTSTYLDSAITISKEEKFIDALTKAYRLKSNALTQIGNYRRATETLDSFIAVKDSINELEKYNILQDIETKYATKEKEEQLKYIEKEKAIQESTIKKARNYNIILTIFTIVLLFTGYYIYKKNLELNAAKEKAEGLSKAKSKFYSEISHELRTPLYAVIELSSVLLREIKEARHKVYLESLKFSGNHLLSLINNVLELNKVESGKMKLQIQDFNLKLLITNIIDSLEYALRDSNNKIRLNYDSSIPEMLNGDSLKLSQILINLISNGIKYTSDGVVDVRIHKIQDVHNKVVLNFRISDTGMGITKEKQKQIFEDFYQENAQKEKTYEGTGLGLSIVKRMLNILDSEIQIESEINRGSTFYFDLVINKSEASVLPAAAPSENIETIEGSRILVVDDNKINLVVTKKVLDQFKVNAQVIDNGKEAVELAKKNNYDCILMDLHMPEMDGYMTTEMIRRFDKNIPIIALTAASTEEIKSKIHLYHMNGYVQKPFIQSDFLDALTKAIVGNRADTAIMSA